ncbi:MAG: glycosyltransferase family 2 protein [Actinomycetota bacterium]
MAMVPASTPDSSGADRPRVDVAVVTWNTAGVTPQALRDLLDSDQGCDVRLLVRDNASSDGTAEAVASLVPEAEIDAGAANLGFAGGVNTLIARTDAPWLFLLNPDAWPLPGAIGALVRAAEAHPRAAAVVPRLEHPDGALQHSTHPFPSLRVAATLAFSGNRITDERADSLLLEGTWAHDRARTVDWAHAAAWLIRREALDEVGGLEERFFMYAEDLEWCWRATRLGWEIWFEPDAVVRHIHNVSGRRRYGGKRERAHLHSALRFYRRAHGLAPATAWWTLNVAGALVRWSEAARRGERQRARRWRRYAADVLVAPLARDVRRPEARSDPR